MKKIVLAVIVLFFIGISVKSLANSLVVSPSLIEVTIPKSGLSTCRIKITNYGKTHLRVRSNFNPDWMDVYPIEVELPKGKEAEVQASFIFSDNMLAPPKNGEIIFRAGDEVAKVEVIVAEAAGVSVMSPEKKEIKKLKKEVRRLNKELDKLKPYKEKLADYEAQIRVLQNKVSELQSIKKATSEELQSLYLVLINQLEEEINAELIQITWSDDARLLIIIPAVFASGQIYPGEQSSTLLEKVGGILKDNAGNNVIEIRCHADIMPVSDRMKEEGIFSNWELSTLRASTIARMFQFGSRIEGKNLLVSGCSFYRPIYDSRTIEGMGKNRRVEIFILVP